MPSRNSRKADEEPAQRSGSQRCVLVAAPGVETDLSNKNNCPAFPHNYWKDLHDAHHRWGGSKSEKYEIMPYLNDNDMLADWCANKFAEWLQVRKLQEFITLVRRWEWHGSLQHNHCIAFTYKYDPPTSQHQRSHHRLAQTHPIMRVASKSHEPIPTSLLLTMVQLFLDWQGSCTHMRWRMDFMGWSPTCLTLLSTRPPSSTTRPHTRFHLVPSMTTCTLQLFWSSKFSRHTHSSVTPDEANGVIRVKKS